MHTEMGGGVVLDGTAGVGIMGAVGIVTGVG
jgi:hypothetical protein